MTTSPNRWRTAAIGLAAGAAGLTLGLVGIAGAQDSGSSSTTAPSATAPAQPGPQDPAAMAHGPDETLLTGDTAAKVTAAAQQAVPGGTIIRVETDSDGSPYEAHVRKADGTEVTVKFDDSFKATATEQGFGRGPGGPRGPMNGSQAQPGSTTTTG